MDSATAITVSTVSAMMAMTSACPRGTDFRPRMSASEREWREMDTGVGVGVWVCEWA